MALGQTFDGIDWDGNGLILRIHGCRGGRANACIRPGFPMASYQKTNLLEEEAGIIISAPVIETCLRPFEIQTFRITSKGGI